METLNTEDLDTRRDELREDRKDLMGILAEARKSQPSMLVRCSHPGYGALLDEIDEIEEEIGEIDTIEGYCADFHYGETLIHERDFVEYAQELAEDIGQIEDTVNWPNYCIDWERAARDLAMDYSMVAYRGADYYTR